MLFLWPIKLAIRLVELLVLAALVYLAVSAVQVWRASSLPTAAAAAPKAAAIVVLSTPLTHRGQLSTDDVARLDEALALRRAGRSRTILVCGTVGSGAPDGGEARQGAEWLAANGIHRGVVVVGGDNAAEQLRAAAVKLPPGSQVLVVADALDALWVQHAAAEDGLVAKAEPAVGSERLVVREVGTWWQQTSAVAVGRVIGYGRVSWA